MLVKGGQALRMRLQQPTLVLDLAFLLPLLGFVAPQAALQGAQPQPWRSFDLVLGPTPHAAQVGARIPLCLCHFSSAPLQ